MKKLATIAGIFLLSACGIASAPASPTTVTPSVQPIVSSLATTLPMTTTNPHITMVTSMGTVKLELYADKAPKTVTNFVTLAKEGFYNGVLFHRVIPGFMAQSGDPLTKNNNPYDDGTGGPGYTFADEFAPGLSNVRGTIAMANRGPNTNGSQFFINVVDNSFLNGKHAVFGKVIEGLDIVDKIVNVPTRQDDARLQNRPVKDIKILSVSVE